MKWIGQQIYDQVSRFRNDTYFEKDVYFQGDTVTFTSANADDPAVIIENTTADAQAARLQFKKHRGVDAVDGDNVGEIEFWGYDDGTPSEQLYSKVTVEVHDATSGQESGAMYLSVANHDGGQNTGLKLTGGSVDNEVDVEIGRGGSSVTDVQGTLSMGGTATINNSGVIQVAAQTVIDHDQLANFAANEHYTQNTITTVGTIGTGVWNGTAIASAYLDADTAHLSGVQTFTGRKTFGDQVTIDGDHNVDGSGDGAALHIDAHDITDAGTSASGTAAMYTHVNIEAPRLLATNSSVTTTNAASLYIKNAPLASTNQTITNAYALWVDDGNARFDGNIDLAGDIDVDGTLETDALTIGGAAVLAQATSSAVGAVELATTGEADTGTDTTRAVTAAGLKSHVDARYSYAYMTWSASGTSSMDGSDPEWVFPNTVKGIYEEDWTKDENIKATSVGTTTYTVTRQSAVNGLVIPHAGQCVGFHAHGRNGDSDATFKTGLFHLEGSTTGTTNNGGVDYGATGNVHETTLRFVATANEAESSGGADGTSSHSFKGPCKLVSNTTALDVSAGDVLLPAIMGPDGSDEIFITMTIILKIPLTT